MAVYQLLRIDREVPAITRHDKSIRTILNSIANAFA